MKINKLLLFFFIIYLNNILNSFANDEIMQNGLEIFNGKGQCAVCHVLKAAGSEGNIGPNLDTVEGLNYDSVMDIVTHGLGVMPAFGKDEILTNDQIDIVSFYVANSVGK